MAKVYVVVSRQVWEEFYDDEWVHDSGRDDLVSVEGVYSQRPSADFLANICVRLENSALDYYKGEWLDTNEATVEVTQDTSDVRESIVRCEDCRVFNSVEVREYELQ